MWNGWAAAWCRSFALDKVRYVVDAAGLLPRSLGQLAQALGDGLASAFFERQANRKTDHGRRLSELGFAYSAARWNQPPAGSTSDRKSTRLNSSHLGIS